MKRNGFVFSLAFLLLLGVAFSAHGYSLLDDKLFISCSGRIVSNGGFESMLGYIWMNCQTSHYTSMSGCSPYLGKDLNKNFPLDEDAAFSIKGLLKRVR